MLRMRSQEGVDTYVRQQSHETQYVRCYEVLIKSKKLVCPKQNRVNDKGRNHLLKIREIKNYEIFDLVNDRFPAKIVFHVPRWRCLCAYEFDDPAFSSKYHKGIKHTEDYLEYVVNAFIDEPELSTKTITDRYYISEHRLEAAVRNFRKKFDGLDIDYPQCQTIWLYQFTYKESRHIVGFGLPVASEENAWGETSEMTLLGFCEPTLDAAEAKFQFTSTYFAPQKLIVTTQNLYNSATQKGYVALLTKREFVHSKIEQMVSFIKDLEDQGKSYNLMTCLVWYQSRERREESRRQNLGRHLQSGTIMKTTPALFNAEYPQFSLMSVIAEMYHNKKYIGPISLDGVIERFLHGKTCTILRKKNDDEAILRADEVAPEIYIEEENGQITFV